MLATAASWSFAEPETAIRACWDEQTCDPAVNWDPAAGHCGVTSMALRELLGGVLLLSEVFDTDGEPDGLHNRNRLPTGLEIDLTRDQFRDGHSLGVPSVQQPVRHAGARMASRCDLFASRVRGRLGTGHGGHTSIADRPTRGWPARRRSCDGRHRCPADPVTGSCAGMGACQRSRAAAGAWPGNCSSCRL
jgi:hypothetical protein